MLIDEAGSIQTLWEVLDLLLGQDRRIAILLVDQYPLRPPVSLSREALLRIEQADTGILRLDGLSDEALSALAPNLTDEACVIAEGRPLYALLGNDAAAELSRRAARRIEKASSHSERMILMAAALAGPMQHEDRRTVIGPDVSVQRLEIIFEGADRDTLRKILPAVRPEALAAEIVLQLAADIPDSDLGILVEAATAANPGAVERRLASLWLRPQVDTKLLEIRDLLREAYDRHQADRIAHLHERAASLAARVDSFTVPRPDGAPSPGELAEFAAWLDHLEDLARLRPFDVKIRRSRAAAIAKAMPWFGDNGQLDELERSGVILVEMARQPDTPGDAKIASTVVTGAAVATMVYAELVQIDDMARWSQCLDEMAESLALKEDQLFLAFWSSAAVYQIAAYGLAERFDEMEAIGDSDRDEELLFRTKAAANAISAYSIVASIAGIERWITRIPDELPESKDERLEALRCKANCCLGAMSLYGREGNFAALEGWGDRLLALGQMDGMEDDTIFRASLARAVGHAMGGYGVAQRFADLERWASRLSTPAVARSHPEILRAHAWAATQGMGSYGAFERFEELEKWGDRLLSYCMTPELGESRALRMVAMQGASDAIHDYGRRSMLAQMEDWGSKFWHLADGYALLEIDDARALIAKTIRCAIVHYMDSGGLAEGPPILWIEHIAYLARAFRHDLNIQHIAMNCGVDYAAQEAQGWPMGDPPPIATVGAEYRPA